MQNQADDTTPLVESNQAHRLLSRSEYEQWLKQLPSNYCAFCQWEPNQYVLKEGVHWLWIANLAPYWRYHTMLVPKRHVIRLTDLTVTETGEMYEMLEMSVDKLRAAQLRNVDGTPIKKFIFFWRLRDDTFDYLSGNIRPDHLHLHVTPDRDHLFDPVLDGQAYQADLTQLQMC